MFGQMKAARDREWQEDFAREHRRREGLAQKYNMPDDIGHLVGDFERALLRDMPPERVEDALIDFGHLPIEVRKPTLRCRLFGCKPQGPCYLAPYCMSCEDRCIRCSNFILPKASTLRR